jgi:protein gp37
MERWGRDFSQVRIYPEKLRRLARAKFEERGRPFRRGPGSRPLVFVVNMGDLFHPDVPDDFIVEAIRVMAQRDDVDWLVLTKRVDRMLYFDRVWTNGGFPPNVWPGATMETQKMANQRAPLFMRVRASVRWLSLEPMLEPIELFDVDGVISQEMVRYDLRELCYPADHIDWIVVGAESGPNRRPFDEDWARRVRDDCLAAGVPFFYKQGSHRFPGRNDVLDGRTWKQFPR